MEPTYYIGGGNGNAIIEEIMNGLGWKRIKDKLDDTCKLRWCESKTAINYNIFKEGEQLVNHIPNCHLLTNKLGLLNTLLDYSRACGAVQKNPAQLDFIPETRRLENLKDREAFVAQYKENEIWICKPTGRNQGKGIFLIRSLTELDSAIQEATNIENLEALEKSRRPLNRIIQRYITNPLLIEGRKFDIRCYMLVASTQPFLVLYHKGYLRLSMYEYDNNCDNLIAHLTNQYIQKRDPRYSEVKENTAWSMDRFNQYINEMVAPRKRLEKDWVNNTLPKTMKYIMTYLVMAVKHRLQAKVGYFDLYGLDFMIDENMKVWLIEVNMNPCLATNCKALREVVPGVVEESLNLAIECFEKSRRNRPLNPLKSLKQFQIIYNAEVRSGAGTSKNKTPAGHPIPLHLTTSQLFFGHVNPAQRVRSSSPIRDQQESRTQDSGKNVPHPSSNVNTTDFDDQYPLDQKLLKHQSLEWTISYRYHRNSRENDNRFDPDVHALPLYHQFERNRSSRDGEGEKSNTEKDAATNSLLYTKGQSNMEVSQASECNGTGEACPATVERLHQSISQ